MFSVYALCFASEGGDETYQVIEQALLRTDFAITGMCRLDSMGKRYFVESRWANLVWGNDGRRVQEWRAKSQLENNGRQVQGRESEIAIRSTLFVHVY